MRAWFARIDGAERLGVGLLAGFVFLASGFPLGVSVAVSPDAIDRGEVQITPPCPLRAEGRYCSTCGMTRGFCAMSRLRWADAAAYNRGAPWLYLADLALFVASAVVLAQLLSALTRSRSAMRSRTAT